MVQRESRVQLASKLVHIRGSSDSNRKLACLTLLATPPSAPVSKPPESLTPLRRVVSQVGAAQRHAANPEVRPRVRLQYTRGGNSPI